MATRASRYYDNKREPRVRNRIVKMNPYLKAVVIAAIFVGISVALLRSPFLQVSQIVVQGNQRTPNSLILQSSGVSVGDSIIVMREGAIEESITSLGSIEGAIVDRRLASGDIVITVLEKSPTLALPSDSGFWLLTSEGFVLSEEQVVPEGVRVVAGPATEAVVGAEAEPVMLGVIEVISALDPALLDRLAEFEFSEAGFVSAIIDGGPTVEFGTSRNIDLKQRDLMTVLERVDLQCVTLIDVTAASLPAIERAEVCQ